MAKSITGSDVTIRKKDLGASRSRPPRLAKVVLQKVVL
jgi:hypothetical protein